MAVHVCHLTSVHRSDDPRIFLKECRSLAHHGYKVSLLSLRGTPGLSDGVRVEVLPFAGGRIRRWLIGRKQVLRAALQHDAALFHVHDPELLGVAVKLVRQGKKVIYDSHEDLPRQIRHKHYIPSWMAGWLSALVERWENRQVKKVSAVVCATEHIRDRFLAVNPLAVAVRNYPSLTELDSTHGKPGTPAICYIGSITRSRGIFELLDALMHTEATLLLGGQFSPPELLDEVRQHPAWPRVQYLGFLTRENVRKVLAQSGVGLVPLHPSPGYSEALPVKMFEYMAAGIPVITSDIALWKQILLDHQCGAVTDIFDARAFAKTINGYLSDPDRAAREGALGKKAVQTVFNWESEAETLIQLYQHVLA